MIFVWRNLARNCPLGRVVAELHTRAPDCTPVQSAFYAVWRADPGRPFSDTYSVFLFLYCVH